MKLIIDIDLDNAAFKPSPLQEVSRIITMLSNNLPNAMFQARNHKEPLNLVISDLNGNVVGRAKTVEADHSAYILECITGVDNDQ